MDKNKVELSRTYRSEIVEIFELIRDEPLNFINNRCWEKHIKLKEKLEKFGYKVKYCICFFNWSNQKIPKEILDLPHEDLDYHLFLTVKINGLKLIVDASNDKLLPEYNKWDGKTNCKLCVFPNSLVEENIEKIIEKKKKEVLSKNQKLFLKKANCFLENLRIR